MLANGLVRLMKEKATQDLEDRRVAFARAMARIREDAAGMDAYGSGGTAQKILDAMETEYRIRSRLIWQAFARVLAGATIGLSTDVASEAKTRLAQMLDEGSTDMPSYFEEVKRIMSPGPPPQKSLATLRQSVIDRVNTEIDLACLKSSRPSDSAPTVSNVFVGCHGVFHTGSGPITLGPAEHRAIADAIAASKQAIAQDSTLDDKQKNEIGEVVSDLEAEANRSEPNIHRMRSLFFGLAEAVQTLAATPGAYHAVKGAAALFGVTLP